MSSFDQSLYPIKRARKENDSLKAGMLVSARGYSATLSERIPFPAHPDDTCAICLDPLGEVRPGSTGSLVSRTCSHTFHRLCIQKWRSLSRDWYSTKAPCPTCRAQVRECDIVFPFNQWRVTFSDGTSSVVPASDIRTPPPTPTPFNPRHRNDLMFKERSGVYDGPLVKRARRTSQ